MAIAKAFLQTTTQHTLHLQQTHFIPPQKKKKFQCRVRSNSGESGSNGASKTAASTANNAAKKLQVAEHRYGREELLHLFSEDTLIPPEMPNLPSIYQTQLIMPLSSMLLTEDEQVWALVGLI